MHQAGGDLRHNSKLVKPTHRAILCVHLHVPTPPRPHASPNTPLPRPSRYLLRDYYRFLITSRERLWNGSTTTYSIRDHPHTWATLATEALVLLPHPFPFCGELLNPWLTVAVFPRFYVFFRCFRDRSTIYRARKEVLQAVYRESPNAPFNSYHTIQMYFGSSPMIFLMATFLSLLFVLAYFVHVMEREYQVCRGPPTPRAANQRLRPAAHRPPAAL